MKRYFLVPLLLSLMVACTEKEDTSYTVQKEITTDYPIAKRIFYNEVEVKGEILPGQKNFDELGFLIGTSKFEDESDASRKVLADEADSVMFSAWIGNLTPANYYFIRAYGKRGGETFIGDAIRILTPETEINEVVMGEVDTANKTLDARTHHVYGKITDDGNDPDGLTEYGAYYWPVSDKSNVQKVTFKTASADEVPVGSDFDVIIPDLLPETEYAYIVYARNNRKEQLCPEASFTTAGTVLPTVRTNAMDKIATTICSASGTIVDNGNDPYAQGGFYLGTSTSNMEKFCADDIRTKNFFLYKKGLTKLTKYYVQAYAENNSGEAKGEICDFTTLDETLPILGSMFYTYEQIKENVTETTVKLQAEVTSDGGSEITECGIYWGKQFDKVETKLAGTLTGRNNDIIEVTVTGLNSGDIVFYKPYAVNVKGESVYNITESLGTKMVTLAWKNNNATVKGEGVPNKWITLSDDMYDEYYEMPALTITEEDGKVYRYYFLDRDLGAQEVTPNLTTEGSQKHIGYLYYYSFPKPVQVPATNTGSNVAQNKYGWVKPADKDYNPCTDWNEPPYNPCPGEYRVPSSSEWQAFMDSLPYDEQNLSGAFRVARLAKNMGRNGNGGSANVTKLYKIGTWLASDCAAPGIVEKRNCLCARDTDSDSDFPGKPYMVVAGPATGDAAIGWNDAGWGLNVRAFRKMLVSE